MKENERKNKQKQKKKKIIIPQLQGPLNGTKMVPAKDVIQAYWYVASSFYPETILVSKQQTNK